MKIKLNLLFAILGCVIFMTECHRKKISEPSAKNELLKIKGSDTEFEMVRQLCYAFQNKDSLDFEIEGTSLYTTVFFPVFGCVFSGKCPVSHYNPFIYKYF